MTDNEPVDPGLNKVYATLPQEVPPGRLDATIVAAARGVAGARSRRFALGLPPAWRLPFAVAAVVVLSVSVVTLMEDQGDDRLAGSPAPPTTQTAERKGPADPSAAVRREAQMDRRAAATARSSEPPTAPVARAPKRVESTPDRLTERRGGRPDAEDVAPTPAAVPMESMPAAPYPGEEARARENTPGVAARVQWQEAVMQSRVPGDSPSAAVKRLMGDLDQAPAEKWLAKIGDLRRDGRDAEAEALLAEFHKRFPAYVAPQQGNR